MPLVRLPFFRVGRGHVCGRRPNIIAFATPIFKDWDMNGF
jgi:hypothetical protein